MTQIFGRGRGILMAQIMASPSGQAEKELIAQQNAGLMKPKEFIKPQKALTENTSEVEDTDVHMEKDISKFQLDDPPSETEDKTRRAEQDWKIFQCKRKINQMLKNVNKDNLGEVMSELKAFVEECPLSSRYTNCSEVNELMEVLIQQAIQQDSFIMFSPSLLKMVAEHSPIEFKKYFQDITDTKRQECITLCASDQILAISGQRFCKLLGHLFAMPRQKDDSFYKVVSPVVEECVERWTYPDDASMNGFKENISAVHAVAIKCLLIQIASHMLPCDNVVQQRMESFIWLVRESILNINIPKKVREIFLDSLIEIQLAAHTAHETVVQNKIEGGDEVVVEGGDEVVVEGYETVSSDSEEKEEISSVDMNDDPYVMTTYILRDQDMEELLESFKKHHIDDSVLFSSNLKAKMEEAGIQKFKRFQLSLAVEKIDADTLRNKLSDNAFEHGEQNTSTVAKPTSKVDESTGNTDITTDRPRSRNSISRLAINFNNKPFDDRKTVVELERSCSDEESEPDIVIEGEEALSSEVDAEVESDDFEPCDLDLQTQEGRAFENILPIDESTNQKISNNERDSYRPGKLPIGRGRGCFNFSSYDNKLDQHSNKPGRPNQNYNRDKPGKKWNKRGSSVSPNWSKQNNSESLDLNKRGNLKSSHWRAGPGDNNFSRFTKPKFQAQYHPKPKTDVEERSSSPARQAFGNVKPKLCLRCQAPDHQANDCPVINPFF